MVCAAFGGAIVLLSCCRTVPPPIASSATRTPVSTGEGLELRSLIARSLPNNEGNLFVGFSERLRDRDQEQAYAIDHIAEQAARRREISVRYRLLYERSTASTGYLDDIDLSWNDRLEGEIIPTITPLSVKRLSTGTVVLARLPSHHAVPTISLPSGNEYPPAWLSTPPRIEGYEFAVGSALRARTVRESIDQADEAALTALIAQRSATIEVIRTTRETSPRGTMAYTVGKSTSEQTVHGFLVIARTISRDGRYFHSLAIAEGVPK